MSFDHTRLRFGETIAGVSAIVLFIVMFFDWFGRGAVSFNAWNAFGLIDLYLLLTVIVALGLVTLTATQQTVALPVAASVITTVLGIIAVLLVLFRIIDPPGFGLAGLDLSPKVGAFLGLISSAGVAFGGYQSMREEGTSFEHARDQMRNAVPTRPAPAAPSAGTSALGEDPATGTPPSARDSSAPPASRPSVSAPGAPPEPPQQA